MQKNTKGKSKILFIFHLPPPVYGATIANQYIKDSALINNGFDAHYINLATNTELKDVGKATFKKPFLFLAMVFKVIKALATDKYDACWITLTATGPAFYKDLIVVSLLKLFNSKIIYFMHNKGIANASENSINKLLYQYAFRNVKTILASKYLYADIRTFVAEGNVLYCPIGIPKTRISQNKVHKSTNSDHCRLLFLGNLMEQKGVLILLEACKILKEKNIKFSCDFVGGWSDITPASFNQQVSNSNLDDIVFVHGPKYNRDKVAFLEQADIFVFPTYYHYETFGMVNLEAMEYGLPIVSTPEGGIPDLVIDGESGFLVPQKDAAALADKLEILIKNPSLRLNMGLVGQKRFNLYYTLETYEQNISNILYDQTVEDQSDLK